jgi:aspartate kinase
VGENIRGQNGIAARVFQAIRHVNVRMISQGASEINMSFMIEEDDADEAIRSLHAEFFSDPDPEIFDVPAAKAVGDAEAAKAAIDEQAVKAAAR